MNYLTPRDQTYFASWQKEADDAWSLQDDIEGQLAENYRQAAIQIQLAMKQYQSQQREISEPPGNG